MEWSITQPYTQRADPGSREGDVYWLIGSILRVCSRSFVILLHLIVSPRSFLPQPGPTPTFHLQVSALRVLKGFFVLVLSAWIQREHVILVILIEKNDLLTICVGVLMYFGCVSYTTLVLQSLQCDMFGVFSQ